MSASVLRYPTGEPVLAVPPLEIELVPGARVTHQKFGIGTVRAVDGNKLTVDFDYAGQKRVVNNFVRSTAGRR